MQPEKLIAHQLAQHLKSADHGAMVMITQEYLKECLHYDPLTGIFVWKNNRPLSHFKNKNTRKSWLSKFAGTIAGGSDAFGYRQIRLEGTSYKAHRLAWMIVNSCWPAHDIDHVDGVKHNNRISNLRDVTRLENQRNKARSKNNSSGVTGVCWGDRDSKWRAYIKVNKKHKSLGSFFLMKDAITARKSAELEYGFHHNHDRSAP